MILRSSVSSTFTGLPANSSNGDAAPVSVPGDIAATSAEIKMKNPADAAREPEGVTYVTTGTEEWRMAPMISRMDESRPPGVSIVIRIRLACCVLAAVIPATIYSARIGSISPLICNS